MIDLFAGCGGLTRGFGNTQRYASVAAVEIDIAAASTYAQNFGGGHVHVGSISDWAGDAIPEADVVVGGPPCQGFSNLGKKLDDDPRNELWREYVRVLTKVRPMAFVVENVDRFLRSSQFQLFQEETRPGGSLASYELRAGILKATEFGSAQVRKRAIVIGTHRDLKPISIPQPKVPRDEWLTVAKALTGVPQMIESGKVELPETVTNHFGKEIQGAFKGMDLHITRNYEEKSLERFAHIPPGGNRFDLPDRLKAPCWIKHTSGSGDVMGRLRWTEPSVTIRTEFFKPEKGRYLHPTEPRAISHYEAALLQGFDERFEWCGTKLQIARQIGNAVPVQLAQAIGQHLANEIDQQS
jgi:DNA (cytosine-5)-methyltransferase 1